MTGAGRDRFAGAYGLMSAAAAVASVVAVVAGRIEAGVSLLAVSVAATAASYALRAVGLLEQRGGGEEE